MKIPHLIEKAGLAESWKRLAAARWRWRSVRGVRPPPKPGADTDAGGGHGSAGAGVPAEAPPSNGGAAVADDLGVVRPLTASPGPSPGRESPPVAPNPNVAAATGSRPAPDQSPLALSAVSAGPPEYDSATGPGPLPAVPASGSAQSPGKSEPPEPASPQGQSRRPDDAAAQADARESASSPWREGFAVLRESTESARQLAQSIKATAMSHREAHAALLNEFAELRRANADLKRHLEALSSQQTNATNHTLNQ